jgi:hypothetical protein
MAEIIIPLRSDIFQYSFTKELDGVVYSFKIGYNLRVNSWRMGIGGLVIPIRLAGGGDLLRQFHHLEVPPGEMRITDLDGNFADPDKTNLGDRVILVYTEV